MITISNLTFSFATKKIFNDVNLDINKGEFVFLVGESGIGKSTLLRLLYFDILPDKGKIIFDEYSTSNIDATEIPYLRRKIGIVYQDFKLLFDRNIFENIALPLYIAGEKTDTIRKRVYDKASQLGLVEKLNEFPYNLSGGEQQRVAVARAIIHEPLLLIADEPTGNLDPFIAIDIIKLINNFNTLGTTVIVATHNFEIVKKFNDKRILQIKEQKVFDVRIKI